MKKVKFKYIQFGRFDPFGAFFGLVADFSHTFYDKLTEEELERVGGDMLIALHRMGENADSNLIQLEKLKILGKLVFQQYQETYFLKLI